MEDDLAPRITLPYAVPRSAIQSEYRMILITYSYIRVSFFYAYAMSLSLTTQRTGAFNSNHDQHFHVDSFNSLFCKFKLSQVSRQPQNWAE